MAINEFKICNALSLLCPITAMRLKRLPLESKVAAEIMEQCGSDDGAVNKWAMSGE